MGRLDTLIAGKALSDTMMTGDGVEMAYTMLQDYMVDGAINYAKNQYAAAGIRGAVSGGLASTGGAIIPSTSTAVASTATTLAKESVWTGVGFMTGDAVSQQYQYGTIDYGKASMYGAQAGVTSYAFGTIAPYAENAIAEIGYKAKQWNANLYSIEKKPYVSPTLEISNPALQASQWQGSGSYPGIDNWENTILAKGSYVWGGTPGQGHFYTTTSVMDSVGTDATELYRGLQVAKLKNYPLYREGVTLYEVNNTIPVAYSHALANGKIAHGGFEQYFIEDYTNVLTPILSRIMTNR